MDNEQFVDLILGEALDRLVESSDSEGEFRMIITTATAVLYHLGKGKPTGGAVARVARQDDIRVYLEAMSADLKKALPTKTRDFLEDVRLYGPSLFEKVIVGRLVSRLVSLWNEHGKYLDARVVIDSILDELIHLTSNKEPSETWKRIIGDFTNRSKYVYRVEYLLGKPYWPYE